MIRKKCASCFIIKKYFSFPYYRFHIVLCCSLWLVISTALYAFLCLHSDVQLRTTTQQLNTTNEKIVSLSKQLNNSHHLQQQYDSLSINQQRKTKEFSLPISTNSIITSVNELCHKLAIPVISIDNASPSLHSNDNKKNTHITITLRANYQQWEQFLSHWPDSFSKLWLTNITVIKNSAQDTVKTLLPLLITLELDTHHE